MLQKSSIYELALITFPFYSFNSQLIFLYNLRMTMQLGILSPLIDLEAMQKQSCTFTISVFL